MDEVEVALKVGRNRVGERADRCLSGASVEELREVSVEERVRLADGDGEAEPVAGRRCLLSDDVVLLQPLLYSGDCLRFRRYEALDLWIQSLVNEVLEMVAASCAVPLLL